MNAGSSVGLKASDNASSMTGLTESICLEMSLSSFIELSDDERGWGAIVIGSAK